MDEDLVVPVEESKKEDNSFKYIVVGMFLLLIFMIGFFVFRTVNDDQFFTYEGKNGDYKFEVLQVSNTTFYKVYAYLGGKEYIIPLRYKPRDTENITLPGEEELLKSIVKNNVYITQNIELVNQTESKSLLALMEFNRILGTNNYGLYKLNVRSSVVESTNRSSDLEIPVIDCGNVTSKDAVIYLSLGDESKISLDNDCVILEGKDGDDLIRVSDRLSYFLLGVQ